VPQESAQENAVKMQKTVVVSVPLKLFHNSMPFYQLRGVGEFTLYSDTPRFFRLKTIELKSAPQLVISFQLLHMFG